MFLRGWLLFFCFILNFAHASSKIVLSGERHLDFGYRSDRNFQIKRAYNKEILLGLEGVKSSMQFKDVFGLEHWPTYIASFLIDEVMGKLDRELNSAHIGRWFLYLKDPLILPYVLKIEKQVRKNLQDQEEVFRRPILDFLRDLKSNADSPSHNTIFLFKQAEKISKGSLRQAWRIFNREILIELLGAYHEEMGIASDEADVAIEILNETDSHLLLFASDYSHLGTLADRLMFDTRSQIFAKNLAQAFSVAEKEDRDLWAIVGADHLKDTQIALQKILGPDVKIELRDAKSEQSKDTASLHLLNEVTANYLPALRALIPMEPKVSVYPWGVEAEITLSGTLEERHASAIDILRKGKAKLPGGPLIDLEKTETELNLVLRLTYSRPVVNSTTAPQFQQRLRLSPCRTSLSF